MLNTDLKFYLSGGASNADPDAALGGVISSELLTSNVLNNLFDDVNGTEHAAGDTNYRCIYLKNTHATETAYAVKVYISSNTQAADDTITIGLDLAGVDGTADTIADEAAAPDPAVTFSAPSDYTNGLDVGDLEAGQVIAIWIKRVVTAGSTAQANNAATLSAGADSL